MLSTYQKSTSPFSRPKRLARPRYLQDVDFRTSGRTSLYAIDSFKDYGVLESIPNQLDSELAVLVTVCNHKDILTQLFVFNALISVGSSIIIDVKKRRTDLFSLQLYWLHTFPSKNYACIWETQECPDHKRIFQKRSPFQYLTHKNEINHPFILRWNPRSKNRSKMWLKQ